MIFAVDIGNSNIVAALMDDEKNVLLSTRIKTAKDADAEHFFRELEKAFGASEGRMPLGGDVIALEEIEGAVIASVVPEVTQGVADAMKALTKKDVLIVRNDLDMGLKIEMDMPAERIGTDLLLDAAAASSERDGRIIIFDLGTSTTCSVVDNHTYKGTIIIPGVAISNEALVNKASQLPRVEFIAPKNFLGKNTTESMQSGIVHATAAMLDGLIKRAEDYLGGEAAVFATGGIAGLIIPHCEREIIYEPDLLLKGLWLVYKKN